MVRRTRERARETPSISSPHRIRKKAKPESPAITTILEGVRMVLEGVIVRYGAAYFL